MTVRHLRIFLAVYRMGGVTRAAETLHMTQPAVTRAIQELERYYGVRLFERINRRLLVTEAGRHLYAQALHLVDLFEQMETSLRDWDALGILRIGSSIALGTHVLPELMLRFRAEHPALRPQVTIQNGGTLQRLLLDNRLDLALIEGSIEHPDLMAEPFLTDRMALLLPPGHPLLQKARVELADLAQCELLLREEGSAGRAFLDHVFAVHGLPVRPAWESASTQALVQAVSKGLGVALLPLMLVREEIERGTVCTREICDEKLERPSHIVFHRNKFLTRAARDFIALCRTRAAG